MIRHSICCELVWAGRYYLAGFLSGVRWPTSLFFRFFKIIFFMFTSFVPGGYVQVAGSERLQQCCTPFSPSDAYGI